MTSKTIDLESVRGKTVIIPLPTSDKSLEYQLDHLRNPWQHSLNRAAFVLRSSEPPCLQQIKIKKINHANLRIPKHIQERP